MDDTFAVSQTLISIHKIVDCGSPASHHKFLVLYTNIGIQYRTTISR